MSRQSLQRWSVVASALLLSTLAVTVYWFSPTFDLPVPSGPSRVGVRAFELVDDSRRGLLGTSVDQPRRIPVRVWYPAADDAQGPTRPYLERYQAFSLGRTFGEGRYFYAYLSRVKTHSLLNAPERPGQAAWPLVLFNHGFWSYPEQNTAMMELLASHGYVVVSIGHPGDSVETRFADGTVVRPFYEADAPTKLDADLEEGIRAFMGAADAEARFAGLLRFEATSLAHRISVSARAWRDDNLFTHQALERDHVPASLSELTRKIDFDRVAVVGMSFGGTTAASVCQRLSNCRAAVNLDGESFDFSMYNADLRAPLLLILTGQRFSASQLDDPGINPVDYAYERWAHTGERADVIRMRVPSMRHLGLMDLLLSAPRPSKERLYGAIDGGRGVALVNNATLGFLDRYLQDQNGAFTPAFYEEYPEAQPHDASHVKRWWLGRNVALGCSEALIREARPSNDVLNMRLGSWARARTACEAEPADAGSIR